MIRQALKKKSKSKTIEDLGHAWKFIEDFLEEDYKIGFSTPSGKIIAGGVDPDLVKVFYESARHETFMYRINNRDAEFLWDAPEEIKKDALFFIKNDLRDMEFAVNLALDCFKEDTDGTS